MFRTSYRACLRRISSARSPLHDPFLIQILFELSHGDDAPYRVVMRIDVFANSGMPFELGSAVYVQRVCATYFND